MKFIFVYFNIKIDTFETIKRESTFRSVKNHETQ